MKMMDDGSVRVLVCAICKAEIPDGDECYSPDIGGHAHDACRPAAGLMCRWMLSTNSVSAPPRPTIRIEHDDQPDDVIAKVSAALRARGLKIDLGAGGDGWQGYAIVPCEAVPVVLAEHESGAIARPRK